MGTKEPPKTWRKVHTVISWDSASAADLKLCIAGVVNSGGAVLFGATRDGGALMLQVFSGDERAKEYVTSPGDISDMLQWAAKTFS